MSNNGQHLGACRGYSYIRRRLKPPATIVTVNMRKPILLLVALAVIASLLPINPQQHTATAQTQVPPETQAKFHPRTTDQLIIKFASNTQASEALTSQVTKLSSFTGLGLNDVGEASDGAHLLKLQQPLDANQLNVLLQKLRDNAIALGIESVALDEIRYAFLAPNDTHYNQ
jgi:hypothetical protein